MVLHSSVESRVGLLKDDYVKMDMEHRRQEQKIKNLEKDKEAEVCACCTFLSVLTYTC